MLDDPDYIATTGWNTRRLIQGINSMLDENRTYNLVSVLIGVNNQYQGIDISSYDRISGPFSIVRWRLPDRIHQGYLYYFSIPDYAYTPFGGGNSSISREIDDYDE